MNLNSVSVMLFLQTADTMYPLMLLTMLFQKGLTMEELLRSLNAILSLLFFICYIYQFLYIPIGLRKPRRQDKPERLHRFAVLVAARNEETVIGDLMDSLKQQSYDMSLVTIFVIADNCTDQTAAIARAHGAVVYERKDTARIGKGYALDALLRHIREDFPAGFDGYFVFDADNLLDRNYIREMNRTFSQGHTILTCYRNSKNYGDNWISSGYALWFLRESRYLNGARMNLGTSCAVSGTGFLFAREILDELDGWPYHLLTEDIQFSVSQILHGRRIAFCPTAVIYDEQPTSFRQSCRQRMRWAKGYIQVFRDYGVELTKGILHGSWSCFDMAMNIMPAFILSICSVIFNLVISILGLLSGDGIWFVFKSLLEYLLSMYLTLAFVGGFTTATEWKNIHASLPRKLLTVFTFPLFMFTYIPISLAAFFVRVEWKPIHHTVNRKQMRKLGTDIPG